MIEFTTQTIVMLLTVACVFAGMGFFINNTILNNKQKALDNDLAISNHNLEQATLDLQTAQSLQKAIESEKHEQEIMFSQVKEKYENAQKTEERLIHELESSKINHLEAEERWEQTRTALHNTKTKEETLQTELRNAKEMHEELQKRLVDADRKLTLEQNNVKTSNQQLADEGKKANSFEATLKEFRDQNTELKENKKADTLEYKALQAKYQDLLEQFTELKTSLQKREENFEEQMTQQKEAKQSLTKEFENLANKIFEEKGKSFNTTSQASIDSMLKPFREQIDGFQKRVNEVHDESIKSKTEINSQIKNVLEIGIKMNVEAKSLTSALKGDSQQRGAWGEAQLERTLEMSGLVEGAHFEAQSSFKDAEGKTKRTDYLIKIPDGKHMIIDSKVSLVAYDQLVSAETPEESKIAMAKHINAVKKHIDDLSATDYTNVIGMHSPSFVLMFMPIEPAYIEALKNNKDLFDYGYMKNIVLVSHTTLIPILRTVSNLWMIDRSNSEAKEISEKAGEIYNSVCLVAERLDKLGNTLKTVGTHYNSTVKALAGSQGLHGKVERFNRLSVKVSKTMTKLEPKHVDFESERLALIIEPINEAIEEVTEPSLEHNTSKLETTK
ncbi:DNA recombination protein RmuC [Marinomonas sp. PE14-40]|uniref:DNA recombination protein RmuC n=1 Tax=Marinomonas sp. PE14-40 TaxID=3060621 RepID=UPI003F660F95